MTRLNRWMTLLILFASVSSGAQDLYDLGHSRAYASHLYRSGQYALSAKEYERIIFLAPADSLAKINLVRSYRLSQDFDYALQRNLALNTNIPAELPAEFAFEYGLSLMASGQDRDAGEFLLSPNRLGPPERGALILGIHVLKADWKMALAHLDTLPAYPLPLYAGLSGIALEGSVLKYKSPGLALSMSAIIPGSGKIYAGQWGDGLIAFAFVGTNAWQSYRGFSNEGLKSPYGWIFGALALAFYAGDLYGSFQAVKRYNHSLDEALRDQAYHLLFDTP